MTAIAVTIAGSDSGGGAGIQADLKTFSALGVYGASVIAALTAQNTLGVTGIYDVPPDFVRAQMDAVFSDLKVDAVKIGMLSRPAVIEAVARGLDAFDRTDAVLDPVMVAASGDPLLANEAVAVLVAELFPRAALITPNLHEAARILDAPVAETRAQMQAQAEALLALGPRAVLVKGGHGDGAESADILLSANGARWFTAPRLETKNTHGTGCTLSSAIAAGLARGLDLAAAVAAAKDYVTAAIRAADDLTIGAGHGPVHHFHAQWTENTQ
ncbi:bifunctional hydroxymethylpyrimidine kinase/phosphomethylpyrimidine kinase [Breoghania sp. L-A4]|uniref:bifunctional hydroxymethylpyrimidine kinase/phosphomethylpyrimidine kinase n=1 Tax=Breoghania sp. L-A4 TaxID=2304600 RepID=UPI000E35F415|nr:bifunctional hydroxymethylpyrimidine kinase/phosphomethylpyrimidine kinase [Breoghania sp. L-A4]AXS41254.1 bifunctional hydroxymethylpyrimidine kinase/phosphomethylpyrimidine kinase [Breoghania sp. L-A4]